MDKVYLAIVHGAPAAEGRLDTPYGRHPRDRTRFTSRLPATAARRAVTTWRVRERFEAAALLEVALHTGRTHQIRVHLQAIGHPVVGDDRYRGDRPKVLPVPRPFLHARLLAFDHPATGERLTFESPLPADLMTVLTEVGA